MEWGEGQRQGQMEGQRNRALMCGLRSRKGKACKVRLPSPGGATKWSALWTPQPHVADTSARRAISPTWVVR